MQLFRTADQSPSRELVTLVVGALEHQLDIAGLQTLPEGLVPNRVSRRLKADADLYRAELSRGWTSISARAGSSSR